MSPSSRTLPAGPIIGAFALAVLFAVFIMLPLVFQRMDTQYPYQGIAMLGPDAEVFYAARVREVYDGFPGLGNTFYSAPKDVPSLQPPLPEDSIAMVGKLLGVDALTAFFLSKMVLAMAAFFALAALVLSVTGRPWTAVISSTALLFGGALLSAPWDLPLFLSPSTSAFEFLRFSRAVNPQWSGTFFFIELFCLAEWIRTGKRSWIVLAALVSVTIVYSYVYAWTYFFAVAGLLTLWYAARREWRRIADLAVFWAVAVTMFIPYAMHLVVASQHPWYTESTQRLGLVLRHSPAIFGVWLGIFIGLSFATRRIWPRTWPLLPAVSLAGLIAINQHLVTGHYIVPHHYHWYFIQPMSGIFAVALFLSFIQLRIKGTAAIVLGSVIIAGSIACAGVQQWAAYRESRDVWGKLQLAAPVLQYIGSNLRAGQVVYSQDAGIVNEVPVITGADVYYATNSNLSLVPTERIRFQYFLDLWLQGVTTEEAAREFPTTRRWTLGSRLHNIYYREASGDYSAIPDNEVQKNIDLYRKFFQLPIHEKITQYPMTAIVTTPDDPQNPVWSAFLSCSREVFAQNGYAIRLMIQPGYPGSCL